MLFLILVTGFSVEEIVPLFADAIGVRNIILTKEFVEAIEKIDFRLGLLQKYS